MMSPAPLTSCRKLTKASQSWRKYASLQVMAPKPDEATSYDKSATQELKEAITKTFGSYEKFVDQ